MEKKHEIKTVEDMLKVVTDENLDSFLKDLGGFLRMSLTMKELAEALGESVDTSFVWIDDGKHDVNIHLGIKGQL